MIGGALGIILVGFAIVVATPRTVAVPCFWFTIDTPASTISVACLQSLWDSYCPKQPYTFPAGYAGWWRSAPQGGMIRCAAVGEPRLPDCGVGTYQNVIVYMRLCNLMYGRVP
jgi:hypothetical protein